LPGHAFVVWYYGTRTSGHESAVCIQNGSASNAVATGTGVPYLLCYAATSGGANAYIQGAHDLSKYFYSTTPGVARGSKLLAEFKMTSSPATSTIIKDGSNVTLTTAGTTIPATVSYNTIGVTDGTYVANGALGEVLIYQGTLSAPDITTIRAYLKARWGTP
jgi:hypothetical protein